MSYYCYLEPADIFCGGKCHVWVVQVLQAIFWAADRESWGRWTEIVGD